MANARNPRQMQRNPYLNPYERRRGGDRGGDTMAMSMDWPQGPPAELTIAELHAMAASAFERGSRSQSMLIPQLIREARREAWDEGYDQGTAIEHGRMNGLLDRQFGPRLRGLLELEEELSHTAGTPEQWSELRQSAIKLLADMLDAHHKGFPDD